MARSAQGDVERRSAAHADVRERRRDDGNDGMIRQRRR
jgi:hypothetical protein